MLGESSIVWASELTYVLQLLMISQNCGEAIDLGIFYHGIAAKRLPLPLLVGPFYKSLLMSFADVDDAKPGQILELTFRTD